MNEKLIIGYIGDYCSKFIDMSFESIKEADKIIFVWGCQDLETKKKLDEWSLKLKNRLIIINNPYSQDDLGMNGKARNVYLEYVKEHFPNKWMLVCDPDEVVDDLSKIKEFIQLAAKDKLYSPKMRHFIGDLGHEDATQPQHHVPNRLFYIGDDLKYPEVEHPILEGKDRENLPCKVTTIWHLAYLCDVWKLKDKFLNHLKKSDIHTPQYLNNWYTSHLFGVYPKTQINPLDIPDVILKEFNINKDGLYFSNRPLEVKHFEMFRQWYDYFKPERILDIGCGLGHYGFVAKNYFFCDYLGIDKSKWAIDNRHKGLEILNQDIEKVIELPHGNFDLILFVDVLEHIEKKNLDKVLKNLSSVGNNYLFSIPFIGNPDLEADNTHKIKESKEWWLEKLSQWFKIKEPPQDWLFKEQIFIGERK